MTQKCEFHTLEFQINDKVGNVALVGMWLSWSSVGPARRWCRSDSLVQQGIFLPESTFSADSRTVSVHHCVQSHANNICARVKDPAVHVRVWWTRATLKHPACTNGWVVWHCHGWLSPGKATKISHAYEKSQRDNKVLNSLKKGGTCCWIHPLKLFVLWLNTAEPLQKDHLQARLPLFKDHFPWNLPLPISM